MFKIGENVVHPLYGAGIIVDFNTENMYELELDNGKMTMFVPSDTIEQVGIRHVYSVAQIDALLKTLQAEGEPIDQNWSRRYKDNMEKIKSGDLTLVAQVVRDLIRIERIKGLSTGEKRMLNSAKKILISEIVCVKRIGEKEAEDVIYDVIK
ncbi:MAG: CarD family transcriptional regulator [Eubacteriaceae bacterium]|jgi:CarD family transcriptional regulator|nr:CarD family transcriptional regulator [Eubacteriaceae bacterium]